MRSTPLTLAVALSCSWSSGTVAEPLTRIRIENRTAGNLCLERTRVTHDRARPDPRQPDTLPHEYWQLPDGHPEDPVPTGPFGPRSCVTLVGPGDTREVLQTNRDTGITDGEAFYFQTRVHYVARDAPYDSSGWTANPQARPRSEGEIRLVQRLRGHFVGSELAVGTGDETLWADEKTHHGYLVMPGHTVLVSTRRIESSLESTVEVAFGEERPFPPAHPGPLRLLSYNTYLLPALLEDLGLAMAAPRTPERARLMVPALRDADVLVLSEVFDLAAQQLLFTQLAPWFPYRTVVVGPEALQNGGAVVLSRWPILEEDEHVYAAASGVDGISGKGAVYARIQAPTSVLHVFGTHMQAGDGDDAREARREQLRELAAFVASRAIPGDEPVVVAGDLNVIRELPARGGRVPGDYQGMLDVLGPGFVDLGVASHRPSVDPARNDLEALATGSRARTLDYVLLRAGPAVTRASHAQVIPIRSMRAWRTDPPARDLSDHQAVLAELALDAPPLPPATEPPAAPSEGEVPTWYGVLGTPP